MASLCALETMKADIATPPLEKSLLLLLRAIDIHWVNHLTAMENLRTGIGLHDYGQRDPLVMYRTEGHKAFLELLQRMQHDVVHSPLHVTVTQQPGNGRRQGGDGAAKDSPGDSTAGRAVRHPVQRRLGVTPAAAGAAGNSTNAAAARTLGFPPEYPPKEGDPLLRRRLGRMG